MHPILYDDINQMEHFLNGGANQRQRRAPARANLKNPAATDW